MISSSASQVWSMSPKEKDAAGELSRRARNQGWEIATMKKTEINE